MLSEEKNLKKKSGVRNQESEGLGGILQLMRLVFLELIRRKDAYLLLILMCTFAIGIMAARTVGIREASSATFLLNLGLSLVYACAHLAVLLTAARQLPSAIEQRTLHVLLARPLSRGNCLLGLWLASGTCGLLVYSVLFLFGWLPIPRLEPYTAALLPQMILLHVASLYTLSALVIAGSLFLPSGINLALHGVWLFLGGKVLQLGSREGGLSAWILAYLPDFSRLNLVTRYTDGAPALAAGTWLGLLTYALLFTALGLGVSRLLFRRRAL